MKSQRIQFCLVVLVVMCVGIPAANATPVFKETWDSGSWTTWQEYGTGTYAAEIGQIAIFKDASAPQAKNHARIENATLGSGNEMHLWSDSSGSDPASGVRMTFTPTAPLGGQVRFECDYAMSDPYSAGAYEWLYLEDPTNAQVGQVQFNRDGTFNVFDSVGVAYTGSYGEYYPHHIKVDIDFGAGTYRVRIYDIGQTSVLDDSGSVGLRTPTATSLENVMWNAAFWHWEGCNLYVDNALIVPEPATLVLLLGGAVAALRRRR